MNIRKSYLKTVGIAGSIRGSGATHLAISLANYAASGLSEKTAYIEADGHGELSHWRKPVEMGYFTEKGVHYYPDVKREDIPIILNRDYDRIIFDFGDKYLLFREEILRCEQKIFLMNLNTWQIYAAERLLEELKGQDWGEIIPLLASSSLFPREKQKIERAYQIHIIEIPEISDPFVIPGKAFSVMNCFMACEAARKHKFNLKLTRRIK